jgi:two-component system heavy metal sensor histidine kinase CusS
MISGSCSHSIRRQLSQKLALLTMVVLGALFVCVWFSVKMLLIEKHTDDLRYRADVIADIVQLEARAGGEPAIVARVQSDAAMRASSRLELWRPDGSVLYADPAIGPHAMSEHVQGRDFTIELERGGPLKARYTMDFASDAKMGRSWAVLLVFVTMAAGALVAAGTWWRVGRQLKPLRELAEQTRSISPRRLEQRLHLDDPAEELLPWIEQFNALMQRLEGAYAQLEGFNADVAHELRTPLAALIGETEVALSRERPADSLRDTLVSNLEELQRLSAMVNDMLFLSRADRGAVARRGTPASLAALAAQVVDFHEAAIDEARLDVRIEGDALLAVDEALFKRALSNLLGNATRYAQPGSQVTVRIAPDAPGHVRCEVHNEGPAIDVDDLPKLFDRFYRGEECRSCDDGQPHHGLGLAIVAAIARMHAGAPLAESAGGRTRIGFTLQNVPG